MTNADPDITAALLTFASRRPDADFLRRDGHEPMRWSALARCIEDTRARFASWDIARGDVVVAAAGDRARDFALLAAMPASSAFLLLAPSLTESQYADMLERTRARAVILPDDAGHALARAARDSDSMLLRAMQGGPEAGAFALDAEHASARRHPLRVAPGVAIVTATSGTTGRPKLVPLSHRSLMAQAVHMGARVAMTPADIAWHGVPLHLAFGKRSAFLLCALNGGSTHCLPESDVDALQAVLETDPSGYLPMTFAVARELLARSGARRAADGRRLRFAIVASGAFGASERERLEAALGAPVLRHYGTTEAGTVSLQALPPAPRSAEGVGRPIDAIVALVDADGAEVAPGDTGEIEVRGPQVFDGYLDDVDGTGALAAGAYRTGDLARFGDDGELRIVDRAKDMINRGGEQISPSEIDDALRSAPGVADAAAFGIAHPRLGEEIVAAVVLVAGTPQDEDAILARVRARVGARKTPRRLWFVDALPRNRAGKVLRSALAAAVGHDALAIDESEAGPPSYSPYAAALGALWKGVLGVASVQEGDRFRALGGDDAKADTLLAQVRAVFGVSIPVAVLDGDGATLAGMAHHVERAVLERSGGAASSSPAA